MILALIEHRVSAHVSGLDHSFSAEDYRDAKTRSEKASNLAGEFLFYQISDVTVRIINDLQLSLIFRFKEFITLIRNVCIG